MDHVEHANVKPVGKTHHKSSLSDSETKSQVANHILTRRQSAVALIDQAKLSGQLNPAEQNNSRRNKLCSYLSSILASSSLTSNISRSPDSTAVTQADKLGEPFTRGTPSASVTVRQTSQISRHPGLSGRLQCLGREIGHHSPCRSHSGWAHAPPRDHSHL